MNSFTRFYLALLGQISYDECPAVPPEMMLLPKLVSDQFVLGQRLDADDARAAVDHVGLSAGRASSTPSWAFRELFLNGRENGRRCVAPG